MFEALKLFDRALLLRINGLHSPLADSFMWIMSQSWHTYLFVFVVAYAMYRKHNPRKAAEFLLGCALVIACTDLSSNFVKHSVKRYRPTHNLEIRTQVHTVNNYEGGNFGFFSGHAANSFGITTFAFLCIYWLRKRYRLLLYIYPVMICYSRMYLGVHYPSDILIGALEGTLFAFLLFFIVDKYFFRFNEVAA